MMMFRSTCSSLVIITMAITLFFVSCGDAPKTKDTNEIVTSSDSVLPGKNAQVKAIEGYMDTLYIDKATFLRLAPKKRKLVFKYYINTEGGLTLHGWRTKNDNVNDHEYDPNNELVLKNGGGKLTIPYGSGSFLGGVVLTKDDVAKIRTAIADNGTMTYVMFEPQKDPNFQGHFSYDIILTDYEPKVGAVQLIKAIIPVVGVKGNPSPPRNS